MQEFPYEIDYYVSEDGRKPFKEWLERLRDVRGRAKIRIRLDRVRLGNFGDSCTVGEGVKDIARAKELWRDHKERKKYYEGDIISKRSN